MAILLSSESSDQPPPMFRVLSHPPKSFGYLFLVVNSLIFATRLLAQVGGIDGFIASCTGSLDGTGQCVNSETSQAFTCTIIPGQVIDCKSRLARSFQCVWISGVQAGFAEFWCDSRVDDMLRSEISSHQFDNSTNSSPLGPGPSGNIFPDSQSSQGPFQRESFNKDEPLPFNSLDPPGTSNQPSLPSSPDGIDSN